MVSMIQRLESCSLTHRSSHICPLLACPLSFARSIGLNNEQAKAFFGIMTTLKSHVCDSRLTMEDAFQSFKESVLGNSAVVRGKQPTPPPTDVPAIAIAPTTPTSSRAPGSASGARPTSSKGTERPNSRGKESSRTGGKSGTVTPRVGEEPTTVPAPPPAPILPRTFSVPIMKQITEYATRTYFQHWRLYRAVFDATQFRPRRHLLVERLRVETVVPDSFRLDDAVDLGQVRADTAAAIAASAAAAAAVAAASESDSKEEKEDGESFGGSRPDTAAAGTPSDLDTPLPDDELSQLVHQHVRKARQQFRALLDANEAQMDARLRAVEQRLAAANNPAGANSTTKSASTKKK